MSYDIRLTDPVTGKPIEMDEKHFIAGGTYAAGGTKELWLNVTYNYSRFYYLDDVFGEKGIRAIYGMTGAESIPILKGAIHTIEGSTDDISAEERTFYEEQGAAGYWMPTKENAIRPLYGLLSFAQMRPDGVWVGD